MWLKNRDIFTEKNYLFFPFHLKREFLSHWNLVIISGFD